ncbi:MAG TPA: PBP1A family penicillin-binding protein, partial [Gemmatimonadales bacterium]|nr:PBP1A family penicillin-binding protein [Gemmatimonadales bacterium]
GFAILLASWTRACAGNSCPSIESLDQYDPDQASKVYAADGRLITDFGLQRRTVVPLNEISPAVIAAFISTEDRRFWGHHGIDYWRCLGALKNDLLALRAKEGCSSITMQLAGNLWPEEISRRDKSLGRKFRETRMALEIEKKYSKQKILEMYLNQIDLGNRAYGVEAAAQRYFGKSARDLNVAEAATLAAIPKSPTRYNPRRHPNYSVQRRNVVINLMRDNGKISAADAEHWKAYPLRLSSRSDFSGVADYFVEYVRQELDRRFGDDLYTQGYRIYTTLDLDMQQAAEQALEGQLEKIENGDYGKFPHKTYREIMAARAEAGDDEDRPTSAYLQGLLVSLDPKTGYIRAMVGGRDFDDSKFNRATQSRRQPGSTFKPFVYSTALEAGYPLSHIIVDSPLVVQIPDQPDWEPKDFEANFNGAHTMRYQLFESRNIPAIKLGLELGEQAVISEATKFGITTPIPHVPSIFIGSADVIPLDMIAAYSTFANQGWRTIPTGILRVEDRKGSILYEPPVRRIDVMDREHAWLITDVLRDVVRRGTAARTVGSRLNFNGTWLPAGGKTGTTNDGFDVWFIGFTPDLVTGVWMGFDQPQKIKSNAQGGLLAAPAWADYIREIYQRRPIPDPWPRPADLTFAEIDNTTGYKATPFCPAEVHEIESFIPGTEPTQFCPIHTGFGIVGGLGPAGQGTAPVSPSAPTTTTTAGATAQPPAAPANPPTIGPMGGAARPPATPPPPRR